MKKAPKNFILNNTAVTPRKLLMVYPNEALRQIITVPARVGVIIGITSTTTHLDPLLNFFD